MPRPIVATIHLDAMQHNLARAQFCAPQSRLWAVVKANAYGHGLARALRGFAAADGLALVEFEHAVRLREMGWTKPILLLEGFFEPADLETMVAFGFNGAVHCIEQIAMLEAARQVLADHGPDPDSQELLELPSALCGWLGFAYLAVPPAAARISFSGVPVGTSRTPGFATDPLICTSTVPGCAVSPICA